HIQKKHMADAALGADTTGFIQYGTEQFIGGNAAFHQRSHFTAADHGDGGFRRLVAVFGVADFYAADIRAGSAGTVTDFMFRADQNGLYHAQPVRRDGPFQGIRAGRMDDRRRHGRALQRLLIEAAHVRVVSGALQDFLMQCLGVHRNSCFYSASGLTPSEGLITMTSQFTLSTSCSAVLPMRTPARPVRPILPTTTRSASVSSATRATTFSGSPSPI